VLAAETSLPAPLPEVERVVEPPPLPPIAAPQAPPQPSAPVAPPRFDADYLDNPKPVYPPLSRRMGEEGKVVLRVFVDASGLPAQVEVRTSSGSERLDRAAVSAIGRWKFVPARQGSEAVAAWVLVPIVFSLKE
jgi:protein TonB